MIFFECNKKLEFKNQKNYKNEHNWDKKQNSGL